MLRFPTAILLVCLCGLLGLPGGLCGTVRGEAPEASRIVTITCCYCHGAKADGLGFICGGCSGYGTLEYEQLYVAPMADDLYVSDEEETYFVSDVDDTEARVRAALALSTPVKQKCSCGGDKSICTCTGNPPSCEAKNCPVCHPKPKLPILDYAAAYELAISKGQPLVVYVNMVYPVEIPGTVTISYKSNVLFGAGPKVVIGIPDGKGGMNQLEYLTGTASVADIEAAIAKPKLARDKPKAAAPVFGQCTGGCGAGCNCPGSAGGACTHCPASAKVRPPLQSYAVPVRFAPQGAFCST